MTPNPHAQGLPRELAPGLWWLGASLELPHDGVLYHAYQSVFVVIGEHSSIAIEAGLPLDSHVIEAQLAEVLTDAPPLRYLWTTHQETPHAGGIARLLERWPETELVSDVSDYHLYFPGLTQRMRQIDVGSSIDLGGRSFCIIEAIMRDLSTTQWGFDTGARALFPGDGFAYSHLHDSHRCGHLAEEVPELDIETLAGFFAEHSLNWTRFQNLEPYLLRLQAELVDRDVRVIGPTHGLPTCDVSRIAPKVIEGLRAMRSQAAHP